MLERTEAAILLDTYGKLLTKRQQEVMKAYYEEDLSLAEIAENLGISRPGVHDLLQRAVSQLKSLEEKLNLAQKDQRRREVVSEIKVDLHNLQALDALPDQAAQLLTGIISKLTQLERI